MSKLKKIKKRDNKTERGGTFSGNWKAGKRVGQIPVSLWGASRIDVRHIEI